MAARYTHVVDTMAINVTGTCDDYNKSEYVTVLLVMLGVISNVLALRVVTNKHADKSSAAVYMVVYAWSNVAALLLVYGVDAVLCLSRNHHPRVEKQWVCSLWVFLASVLVHSRVWLILSLCADRLVCMCFSRLRLQFCDSFTAKAVVLAVMTVLVFTSVHALWWYESDKHGCYLYSDSSALKFWTWASSAIYFFLPCLLLSVTITCLAVSLCVSRDPKMYLTRSRSNPLRIRRVPVDDLAPATVILSFTYILLSAPQEGVDALSVCFPRLWLEAGLVKEIDMFMRVAQTMNVFHHALLGLILVLCRPKSYTRTAECSERYDGDGRNYEAVNNSGFCSIQEESRE